MSRILKDEEINDLLNEVKSLPLNWQNRLQTKQKRRLQYEEKSFEVKGINGSCFKIILRKNKINILDFSLILVFADQDSIEYRLIRYNGKHSSKHTNKLEKTTFGPAFHIHKATQRYQEAGFFIDTFAEETTDYSDFRSALKRFLIDNNFREPDTAQTKLFKDTNLL